MRSPQFFRSSPSSQARQCVAVVGLGLVLLLTLLTHRAEAAPEAITLDAGTLDAETVEPETVDAGTRAIIEGRVLRPDGRPLPFANAVLVGTLSGAATDSTGSFRFMAPHSGDHLLRVTCVGYAPQERPVHLTAGDTLRLDIALQPRALPLEETVVEQRRRRPLDPPAGLDPLEAVTTPGASGDLLRAMQSLPGVGAPGDGAGLFVRGGAATETRMRLNGAPVVAPYRYGSSGSAGGGASGGFFGSVSPYMIEGTSLSMGGFSARYGDALSGILDLTTPERPEASRQYVNVGLAGLAAEIAQPLGPTLGLHSTANVSATGLLFRVNGQRDQYDVVPRGVDGSVSLQWEAPGGSQWSLTSIAQHHTIGVDANRGAFSGTYRSSSTRHLHVLHGLIPAGSSTVEMSTSWSRVHTWQTLGALDLRPLDQAGTVRVDVTSPVGPIEIETGGVVAVERYLHRATYPSYASVLDPTAPTTSVRDNLQGLQGGGYLEMRTELGPVHLRAGARGDAHHRAGPTGLAPRTAVSVRLHPTTQLRVAWGRYHQFPEPEQIGQHTGPATVRPPQARHWIVGVTHDRDPLLVRFEAYHKAYRDLVVRTGPATRTNEGTGRARGVDALIRYGAFLETRVSGWIGYSLLQSTRTQARDVGPDVVLDAGPAPYDLTHQVQCVGKANVAGGFYVGTSFRATTGAPFTPVAGTVPGPSAQSSPGPERLPVDGAVSSERLPAYIRLDVQASYVWFLSGDRTAIAYVALQNATDRPNAIGVTYDAEYQRRSYDRSSFQRSFYAGVRLSL